MGSKHWSQADKQALAALYPETSNEVLGRVFGKSPTAIGLMARSLGVCKSARYMAEEVPRIKPGQQPWNKGKSFDPGGRSVETRFKSGRPACESANYKPIGSLRVTKDGYLEQKITDDPSIVPARRWVALHRLVWEREHGPVPHCHIVETGNQSWRFRHSTAQPATSKTNRSKPSKGAAQTVDLSTSEQSISSST